MAIPSSDDISKARKELDAEFAEVRKGLASIRERLDKADQAGPEDDVWNLLSELSDTVEKVRDGGMFGSGAKGHKKARETYLELKEQGGPA